MVRRAYAQRSVFEVLLPDGDKLWDDDLREIDAALDDEAIVDLVDAALRRRRPKSGSRGRLGTPVVVVLRMLVLKHLADWSFAECEREVRGSLVYRAFCRIDCERTPDAKTLIRLAARLGPETLKDIVERLVHLARARRVARGHRLRVDTTVVETDIHHPRSGSTPRAAASPSNRSRGSMRRRTPNTAPVGPRPLSAKNPGRRTCP